MIYDSGRFNIVIDIIKSKYGKEVNGSIESVRLTASDLSDLDTASTTHVWYGKLVCVGLSTALVASASESVEFDSTNAVTATGGLVGTFYDVYFDVIDYETPTDGEVYFIGYKIPVTDV